MTPVDVHAKGDCKLTIDWDREFSKAKVTLNYKANNGKQQEKSIWYDEDGADEILPLQKMSTTLFAQALSGVGKVREILELPVFEGGGPFPEDHGIELDHVTFSYDGKTDVLRDCSLSVKQGEKVALVGVSGAGKSTIIQLISRFYDTTKGEVRIGGRNVRDIRYEDLLAHTGFLLMTSLLFSCIH